MAKKASAIPENLIKWFILFILCALSVWLVNPITDVRNDKGVVTREGKIRLGLDLKGGTAFELGIDNEEMLQDIYDRDPKAYTLKSGEKDYEKLNAALADKLQGCDERVAAIVRARVDAMGTNEPLIQKQNREETVNGIKRTVHGLLVQLPGVDEKARTAARERLSDMVKLEFRLTHPSDQELCSELISNKQVPEGYELVGGAYRRAKNFAEVSAQPDYANKLKKFQVPDPRWQFMLEPNRPKGKVVSADAITYTPHFVSAKPGDVTGDDLVRARAKTRDGLGGDYVVEFEFSQEGGDKFLELTSENRGRCLAIILDNALISAPRINAAISTSGIIEGDFTWEEANRLSVDLNAGALPAPLKVLSETSVAPTIGEKAIGSGIYAAAFGFLLVAAFMIVYYWYAGIVANIALILDVVLLPVSLVLVSNILGVFGGSAASAQAASGFNTTLPVLTMPGIAGLVLTLGMAVDANVLVFERIREEFKRGHDAGTAVANGYGRAFTAILDSNLTTIIIGIILFVVGTGPVRGFAIMLTGGVIVSMFTAVVVTRMVFDRTVQPASTKPFKMMQFFKEPKFDFMKYGNKTLVGSAVVILATLALFCFRYNANKSAVLAVDLCGGTAIEYDVAFAADGAKPTEDDILKAFATFDPAMVAQYRAPLAGGSSTNLTLLIKTSETSGTVSDVAKKAAFQEEVKRLGLEDELGLDAQGAAKCTDVTKYVTSLFAKEFPTVTLSNASPTEVGSVVGDDLKKSGMQAVLFSLVAILIYVGFRFKFGFGLGGIVALVHDALISFGIFTLCGRQVSLIVITAILTIIGYSINDTVVVFDRIREQLKHDTRSSFYDICNKSINDCLGRTIITSVTTFFAVLALFVFADGSIYDFALTMLIGVVAGTYSSIFIATPVMVWWYRGKRPDFAEEEEKAEEQA